MQVTTQYILESISSQKYWVEHELRDIIMHHFNLTEDEALRYLVNISGVFYYDDVVEVLDKVYSGIDNP